MFLLVPAYPGCPGSKAVKRSLLLLLLLTFKNAAGVLYTVHFTETHQVSKMLLAKGMFHVVGGTSAVALRP